MDAVRGTSNFPDQSVHVVLCGRENCEVTKKCAIFENFTRQDSMSELTRKISGFPCVTQPDLRAKTYVFLLLLYRLGI